MTISLDQLPHDNGAVEGMWLVQLRDPISGGVGTQFYELGKSVAPIQGMHLRRLVCTMAVVGAMRVEGGEPCEVGDCSTLKPAAPEPPKPEQTDASTADTVPAESADEPHVDASNDEPTRAGRKGRRS